MSTYQPASFPGRRRPGSLEHRPSRNGLYADSDPSMSELALYPSARGAEGVAYPPERSLGQIFSVLWRRKFLILASALFVGICSYLISLQLVPRFLAQGVLAIETRPLYMPGLGTSLPPMMPDTALARSEAQILKSRELIETVSRRLKLDEDPELNPYIREATFLDDLNRSVRGGISAVVSALGLAPEREDSDMAKEDLVWAAVVDNVTKNLSVRTDGRSYVIYVEFESESPQVGAAVVNTLMEMFITRQVESASKSMVEANVWVKERAAELRREVDEADKLVQAYRSKYALVDTRMGSVSSQQLAEINTALGMAQADRAQAEARYTRARDEASGRSGTPDAASEVLASPLIQRLREREAELISREAEMSMRLGDSHPHRRAIRHEITNLQSHIDKEINKILRSLQSQVEVARSRENTLAGQLSANRNRAVQTASTEVSCVSWRRRPRPSGPCTSRSWPRPSRLPSRRASTSRMRVSLPARCPQPRPSARARSGSSSRDCSSACCWQPLWSC